MKFLCLGYFEPARIDARPAAENQALMAECMALMPGYMGTGQVMIEAGLDPAAKRLRRVGGAIRVEDGPVIEDRRQIGSVSIIEARDLDEAVGVAAKHPSAQVTAGEALGWMLEVRPLHSVSQPDA